MGDYGIHDEQNTTGFFGCAMHRLRSIPHLDAVSELLMANQARLMAWAQRSPMDPTACSQP